MHTMDVSDANSQQVEARVVAGLPKVVLHDHIVGGIRPETLIELAEAQNYDDLPYTNPDELAAWFVKRCDSHCEKNRAEVEKHLLALTQTTDAIIRITREAVLDLARDNVVYAELRISPEQHLRKGLTLQDVADAIAEGLRDGEDAAEYEGKTITARGIICARRDENRSEEIARLVVDNVPENSDHPYLVAFGLEGPEQGNPIENHKEAFDLLRRKLAPSTVDAGQTGGVDSIRKAIIVGCNRIGHGFRIYEDFTATLDGIDLQFLSGYVRDQRIPLELCPTSNVQTGAVDDIADHPFPLLDDLGFTCTVNTDNRLLTGTTMTDEMMVLVDNFGYGFTDLFQLVANALENAFVDLPTREQILDTQVYPEFLRLTDRDNDGEVDVDEEVESVLDGG